MEYVVELDEFIGGQCVDMLLWSSEVWYRLISSDSHVEVFSVEVDVVGVLWSGGGVGGNVGGNEGVWCGFGVLR